ncbi:hypothetical protein KZO01_09020 [Kurthia zopfii]|uniref:Zinc ribbon protein n=1 Tax=Kurthia zopfii TaxID=1650 RepID=A0A8B4QDE8_9BACL|nr:zinc-ribbon domain-containing protein [Kurthia zopfii]PWI22723.1 hypothetical protein DF281_06015 [Kurthia zopfii]TDR39524.1 putative zinc ribbon protein [Kurthia zopfii]GEK30593.1 hypothetical protein KZO01_09020 [Kurthia zopfii]STX10833.1 Uncharacterised protein [Kurthia zopfii]
MKKSFATEYPHLLMEWDNKKNGNLSPYDVPPKGRKVVWWKCKVGHSYPAQLSHKSAGKQCSECRLLENSIELKTPEVLQYWDYEKNIDPPTRVSYGSNSTFHWKCENGHSFLARVKAMTRNIGKGCPYCRGLRVDHTNSLAGLYPSIADEWVSCVDDPELTPDTIAAGSNKQVKWRCRKGHDWNTTPKHRTTGQTGCKKCRTGRRISKQAVTLFFYLRQSFDDVILEYPLKGSRMALDLFIPSQKIAIEYDGGIFHRNANRDIRKEKWLLEKMPDVTMIRLREPNCDSYSSPNSKVITFYLSDQKKETFARCIEQLFQDTFHINMNVDLEKDNIKVLQLMDRTEVENSLGEKFPELAKEWDTEKNSDLTPYQFRAASHEKVHWKCKKNHSWPATIASRSHGKNNCPECGSRKLGDDNNLAVKFPNVAKEWHPTKNKKGPEKYFPAGHFLVWWRCSDCQYDWEALIYNRTSNGSRCPNCLYLK